MTEYCPYWPWCWCVYNVYMYPAWPLKSEIGFYDMVLKSFQRMTFGKEGMQEIMLLYFYPFVFSFSSNLLQFFKIECIVTGIWDTSWSVYISPGKHKQDSLSVWLVDLVADWQEKTSRRQTGRLTDWLPGWLVETLSNWPVVCVIEWLSDRLVAWELKDGPLQKQKWVWCVYTHTSIMIRYCPCPLPLNVMVSQSLPYWQRSWKCRWGI